MSNPYTGKPDTAFWRRSVSAIHPDDVDPIVSAPFRITRTDAVATAGSCFAQEIARWLRDAGFNYLVTETGPATPGATDENFSVYTARYGNLYTTRQLLQLFLRAYGEFEPVDVAWTRRATFVDPFRPNIQADGFASVDELAEDRRAHLRATRAMFEQANVFAFTLGLTEGWRSKIDGAVFPLAPGVEGSPSTPDDYEFHNFTVAEMRADLEEFIRRLRAVNPAVRIILTVSPVALMATYAERHVLTATTYSKAALRVVAEEIVAGHDNVAYFPSYEIITGPHQRSRYYQPDLRSVTAAGVANVMRVFQRHFVEDREEAASPPRLRLVENALDRQPVICDEESLDATARGQQGGGLPTAHDGIHASLDEFLGNSLNSGLHEIHENESIIDLQFRRYPSDALFVFFSASIPKDKVGKLVYPFLRGRLDLAEDIAANVLSIGDPSLRKYPLLRAGWHIGNRDLDLQAAIKRIVEKAVETCGAKRLIFVGASSGGFAAMAASVRFPGSIAIVTNSQFALERYYPESVSPYLLSAFGVDSIAELAGTEYQDRFSMLKHYWKSRNKNYLLYIQNITDRHHVHGHLNSLAKGIGQRFELKEGLQRLSNNILLYMDNWGTGHVAVPPTRERLLFRKIAVSNLTAKRLFAGEDLPEFIAETIKSRDEDRVRLGRRLRVAAAGQ